MKLKKKGGKEGGVAGSSSRDLEFHRGTWDRTGGNVGGGETLLTPGGSMSGFGFLTVTHKGFWFVETRVLHTEDLHASCSSIMLFARV